MCAAMVHTHDGSVCQRFLSVGENVYWSSSVGVTDSGVSQAVELWFDELFTEKLSRLFAAL